MDRIGVVFTYHNRKEKTLRCVERLLTAQHTSKYDTCLEFFACDDGSTDGTSQELLKLTDKIHIVKGDGNLFWARGMSRAMEIAESTSQDFYLMVNDDVDFFPTVIDVMLSSFYSIPVDTHAVVGSTTDALTGEHTYGGLLWNGRGLKEQKTPIYPTEPCQECNQTNWNCFLLPKKLYDAIGKIDDYYEHSWADFDYSNRIVAMGYKIYVASEYIGYCSRNKTKGTWADKSLSYIERFKAINKKTGLPPKSYWHYCKKYYGLEAVPIFLRPYLSIVKSSLTTKRRGK